jgi:hypothetical protein
MKNVKWIIALLVAALLMYVLLMQNAPAEFGKDQNKSQTTQVKKRFDEQGRLKADVEVKNGKRNGLAHNYYESGAIHSEINYVNDVKQGNSIWYFPNGKIYRITPYENGKKNGQQKKYYDNGKLLALIPYKNDTLQPGTLEYTKTGTLITDYPDFQFTALAYNQVAKKQLFKLEGRQLSRVLRVLVFGNNNTFVLNHKAEKGQNSLLIPVDYKALPGDTIVCWINIKTKRNNLLVLEKKIIF